MATLAELEAAFVKADDAGNKEDAQAFATELRRMRGTTPTEVPVLDDTTAPPPAEPPAVAATPTAPPSIFERTKAAAGRLVDQAQTKEGWQALLGGAGTTLKDAPVALGKGAMDTSNMLLAPLDIARDLSSGDKVGTLQKARAKQAEEFAKTYATNPDSLAFGMTSTLPELALTGGGLSRVAAEGARMLPNALGRLAPVVSNAGVNAGYEAGKSALKGNSLGDTGSAAAWGAAGSLGGDVLARTIGGLRAGLPNAVQAFIDRGGVPSLGKTLGSAADRAEKWFGTLPLIGSQAGRSEGQAMTTVSRAEANRAAEAIGGNVGDRTGSDAADYVERIAGDAYNRIKPHVELTPSAALQASQNAIAEVSQELPQLLPRQGGQADQTMQIRNIVNRYIADDVRAGRPVDGDTYKRMESALAEYARDRVGGDAVSKEQARAARIVLRHFQGALSPTAGAPASVVQDLRNINRAWALNAPVQDAAFAAGGLGHFTPRQFQQAVGQRGNPGAMNRAQHEFLFPEGRDTVQPYERREVGNTVGKVAAGSGVALGLQQLAQQAASGTSPGAVMTLVALGTTATGAPILHGLANTETGRRALLNGLSGLVPDAVLSRLGDAGPLAWRQYLRSPEFANVASQVGRATSTN